MGQTQTQTDDANVGYSRSDGVCTYVIIGMYVQLYARVRTLEPRCEIPRPHSIALPYGVHSTYLLNSVKIHRLLTYKTHVNTKCKSQRYDYSLLPVKGPNAQ